MKNSLVKNFFLVLSLLFISVILTPNASAVLTTADAISSFGMLMMIFILGLGSAGIGVYVFGKESKSSKVMGLLLCGFGFLMILAAINLSLSINSEMATGFDDNLERVVIISSTFIRVMSYFILGAMFFMLVGSYRSFLSKKKSSDGWDNNEY